MQSYQLSEEEYEFVFKRTPRICLDFIFLVEGKILLTKRKIPPYENFWHVPGGRILHQEKIQDASKRIIKSELGINLEDKPELIGYMEFPKEKGYIHSISMGFLIKTTQEKIKGIKINEQSDEFNLFAKLPKEMHPVHKKFIEEKSLI